MAIETTAVSPTTKLLVATLVPVASTGFRFAVSMVTSGTVQGGVTSPGVSHTIQTPKRGAMISPGSRYLISGKLCPG